MSACRRVAHGKSTGVQTIRIWRATVSRVIRGAPRGFRGCPQNSMTCLATLVGPTTRDLLVSGPRKSKRDPEVKILVVTVLIVQPRCTRWLIHETSRAPFSSCWRDIPNDRMLRWDETDGSVSVLRQPAMNANGHTVDLQGRLVSCERRGRRYKTTPTASTTKVPPSTLTRTVCAPRSSLAERKCLVKLLGGRRAGRRIDDASVHRDLQPRRTIVRTQDVQSSPRECVFQRGARPSARGKGTPVICTCLCRFHEPTRHRTPASEPATKPGRSSPDRQAARSSTGHDHRPSPPSGCRSG